MVAACAPARHKLLTSVRSILACTGAPQYKGPIADVSAMPVVGNGNLSALSLIDNRYMQIFSEDFCSRNWRRTINIHHSFLPAFEGELVLCVRLCRSQQKVDHMCAACCQPHDSIGFVLGRCPASSILLAAMAAARKAQGQLGVMPATCLAQQDISHESLCGVATIRAANVLRVLQYKTHSCPTLRLSLVQVCLLPLMCKWCDDRACDACRSTALPQSS